MRRKLSAALCVIQALLNPLFPVLTRLFQTVGATHGFAPQSPDAAQALRRL